MNLAELDSGRISEDGVEVELVHPVTGAKLGAFVTLLGPDAEVVRERARANILKRRAELAKEGREGLTLRERDADRVELLVAATKAWRDVDLDGPLEFSPANAHVLYTRFRWIAEQLEEVLQSRGNFMPASSTGSSPSPSTSSGSA